MNASRDDALKIGVLFSRTGLTAFVEETQARAVLLAIDEVNAAGGVGGRPVVPVEVDAQSDPARFAHLAERLLGEEAVALIVGCYMSNTRQAVVPIVERYRALLAYPSPYEGFEYSANVVYGGAVPNQHIVLLARHLMRHAGKRFYLVGTRYAFPIESNRVMITLVTEQGGQVLAERYVPLDARRRDFAAIAEDIRKRQPDVVFCTVIGEAARLFYEACRDAGLDESLAIAGLTITEAEVEMMGPALAAGHLTAATYFQSIDSPENARFLAAYAEKFGSADAVNAMTETAYSLTHQVLAAVDSAGSSQPEAIKAALCETEFAAPQGRIRIDPDNSHFYLWPRIGRLSADGRFDIVEQAAAAVKPDPYLVRHSIDDCDPSIEPVDRHD